MKNTSFKIKSIIIIQQITYKYIIPGYYDQTFQELDKLIGEHMRRSVNIDGKKNWECLSCGKCHTDRREIVRHVESAHIVFPGVNCHLCGKHSKTRNALRNHIYTAHNLKLNQLCQNNQ